MSLHLFEGELLPLGHIAGRAGVRLADLQREIRRAPMCLAVARARAYPSTPGEFVYYATYTTTRQNLAALEAAGIRVLLGPDQLDVGLAGHPRLRYAIDNGAWGAFVRGGRFDDAAFWAVLERWGEVRERLPRPDWIVCPDIVAGGLDSLALSLRWLSTVREYGHPLIAVQDGMGPEHVEEHVGPTCGLFLGGTTAWKWATLPKWAAMARVYRCHLHVGRVNSVRGIRVCRSHGVTSADGTSASRFSVNAPKLGAACRGSAQVALPVAA